MAFQLPDPGQLEHIRTEVDDAVTAITTVIDFFDKYDDDFERMGVPHGVFAAAFSVENFLKMVKGFLDHVPVPVL